MSTGGVPVKISGRWDVRLRFLDGPLALREDLIRQGPVIRIGANPGPDGLRLEGYRGIDDRSASSPIICRSAAALPRSRTAIASCGVVFPQTHGMWRATSPSAKL